MQKQIVLAYRISILEQVTSILNFCDVNRCVWFVVVVAAAEFLKFPKTIQGAFIKQIIHF